MNIKMQLNCNIIFFSEWLTNEIICKFIIPTKFLKIYSDLEVNLVWSKTI